MRSSVLVRVISLAIVAALAIAVAAVPALVHTGRVAAQTSATSTPVGTTPTGTGTGTTPTGTGAGTPGTVPTVTAPGASVAAVTICGPVQAFTGPTATGIGSITISGVTLPLAVGSGITGTSLVKTNGAAICLLGNLNSAGAVFAGNIASIVGNVPSVSICGTVSSFTAAGTAAGAVSLGGLTFVIPVGSTFNTGTAAGSTSSVSTPATTVTTGGHYCLQGTLNASGQLIAGSIGLLPLAATPVYGESGGFRRAQMIAN